MAWRRRRLVWILSVGLGLIGSTIFYLNFFLARPIGEGPAGPLVDPQAFAQLWSERPIRVIGIGDSITAGLGANSADRSYFHRLVSCANREFPELDGLCLSRVLPNLKHENFAISGSTSRDHLSVIDNRLKSHGPEEFGLVMMTTGGNDLIHSYGRSAPRECAMYGATMTQAEPWIAAFRVRLAEMLDKINASFPGGCEIYLADIYDPTDGVGDAPSIYLPHWPDGLAIHAKYNEIINECAKTRPNVHIVPLYKTFLGHGAHCRQFWRSTYDSADPHYWYYHNIEDPNDRGYDAIRRVFLNTIVDRSSLAGVAER